MKVVMRTSYFNWQPGDVVEVNEDLARHFIFIGNAYEVVSEISEKKVKKEKKMMIVLNIEYGDYLPGDAIDVKDDDARRMIFKNEAEPFVGTVQTFRKKNKEAIERIAKERRKRKTSSASHKCDILARQIKEGKGIKQGNKRFWLKDDPANRQRVLDDEPTYGETLGAIHKIEWD